jgi:hypothetical protein
VVTSLLAYGAVVGFMVGIAAVLTALDRRMLGIPPTASRRRRARKRAHRRRHVRPALDVRRVLGARRTPPRPERRAIQVVAADLRRLSRELAAVPAGAPLVRWKALWHAYDRVLVEAAELLDVPHDLAAAPIGIPRDIERLRVLCQLEAAGLVVHD